MRQLADSFLTDEKIREEEIEECNARRSARLERYQTYVDEVDIMSFGSSWIHEDVVWMVQVHGMRIWWGPPMS